MRTSWERRIAIAAALLGIVLLFLGLSLYLVRQQMTSQSSYFLIAGVALFVVYGILDPSAVLDLVRSRQARFGSLSAIVTLVVLGILVLVNVLASRGTQAADFSKARFNTLAPQSQLAARKLDSDLSVIGFFRPNQGTSQKDVNDLLQLYRAQSSHVRISFEDPDLNRDDAQRLGVTIAGSIVLLYKNKPPEVLTLASQNEQDITAAILKLESNKTPVVCWAVGEGERDRNQSDGTGFSTASQQMTKSNYKVQDLLISQVSRIPPECDVVALVGAQNAITDDGVRSLSAYLQGGGKLLVAMDPFKSSRDSVNAVLKPYKVSFNGGLVVDQDPGRHAQGDTTNAVVFTYGNSPIAKGLTNAISFFPQPTSIDAPQSQPDGAVAIASTSNQSYQVAQQRDDVKTRQAGDKAGPFVVMETIEQAQGAGKPRTRIVLVGTAAYAENTALSVSGANQQLFVGSLAWLSQQEDLISIPAKPSRTEPLVLSEADKNLNIFLTVVLMPLLVAVGGIMVWWRRRAAPA
jgi:ABC-type uncharacterized transport system involved in gliding motility auxiliary subunit